MRQKTFERGVAGFLLVWITIMLVALLMACASDAPITAPNDIESAKLGQSIPSRDSLDVVVTPATIFVDSTAQACAFVVFSTGIMAMRSKDAEACSAVYVAKYSLAQRTVAPHIQRWVDTQCLLWTSSNTVVAIVTSEVCTLI